MPQLPFSARVATAVHPRWTGRIAVAAPVLMWSEFLVFALLRPRYNILTRAASDLGSRGAPNAIPFTIGFFFLGGLATTFVGLGLLTVARHGLWRLGAGLIALAGALLVTTGAFPNAGAGATSAALHGLFSQTCFALVAVAPVLLVLGSRDAVIPAWVRRCWLASSIAALVIEVSDVVLRHYIHIPDGIFQRPFLLALTVWFVATGSWLLRHLPVRVSAQDA